MAFLAGLGDLNRENESSEAESKMQADINRPPADIRETRGSDHNHQCLCEREREWMSKMLIMTWNGETWRVRKKRKYFFIVENYTICEYTSHSLKEVAPYEMTLAHPAHSSDRCGFSWFFLSFFSSSEMLQHDNSCPAMWILYICILPHVVCIYASNLFQKVVNMSVSRAVLV